MNSSRIIGLIMLAVAAIFVALIFSSAKAATLPGGKVIAELKMAGNDRVQLYVDRDVCQGRAFRATFVPTKGRKIDGCWRMQPEGMVRVVFFDGDVLEVPGEWFKKPLEA